MEPNVYSNLTSIIFRYRSRLLRALGMVFISNFLLVLNPLLIRQAILIINPGETSERSFFSSAILSIFGDIARTAWPWAFLLIVISLLSAYFKYVMRVEFLEISRDAEKEVRDRLFEKIQNQSRSFFDKHTVGELLSRLSNDILAYRDLVGPGLMFPIFFVTLVIPGLSALFFISLPLALLTLVPILLIPLINAAIRAQIYKISYSVQAALAEMSRMAQEHYSGIRIVKSYLMEKALLQRFALICQKYASLNFRLSTLQGLLYPLFNLVLRSVTIFVVVLAAFIILKGWSILSTADFVSFIWLQSYIFFPVLMLSWVLPIYERGQVGYRRIIEVYNEPIEVQDNPKSTLKVSPKSDISFKNLTFYYPRSRQPALSNVSLDIKAGTFVGITGPVGAGKTTLFRLLNREYEVPRGSIFINSLDIHDYSLTALHEAVVTVEQASFLFSRSVAENVRFAQREASREDLERVSQFADLHETIMEFPEGYETVVGERGVLLSGGQRQRVAVARAFLVNRSILLLDEIFAAVDFSRARRIFMAIRQNFQGKTVILITHRVAILEQLDRVIYMANGEIKEDGSPENLKAKKGFYSALVELQELAAESLPEG